MDFRRKGRTMSMSKIRKRNALVGACIVLAFGTQIYLTILSPMMDPKPYQDIRDRNKEFISSFKPAE